MSGEISQLFIILKQIRKQLEETVEKTGEASKIAVKISGARARAKKFKKHL